MYKEEGKKIVESGLYLATQRFLVMMHKQFYKNETTESLSKSQFAIVLPAFLEKEKQFIKEILRPMLIQTRWISETDFKSKLLFFGQLQAALYSQQFDKMNIKSQHPLKIEREKKYLSCMIQRSLGSNSLTIQLDVVQMKYDRNFIAASKSYISSSEHQLYAPKFLYKSKEIHIPVFLSKKTQTLPKFLLRKIFANSRRRLSFEWGDSLGFFLDGEYQNEHFLTAVVSDFISEVCVSCTALLGNDFDISTVFSCI